MGTGNPAKRVETLRKSAASWVFHTSDQTSRCQDEGREELRSQLRAWIWREACGLIEVAPFALTGGLLVTSVRVVGKLPTNGCWRRRENRWVEGECIHFGMEAHDQSARGVNPTRLL